MRPPGPASAAEDPRALPALNAWLATQTAEARVAWALASLSGGHALSTSFGAQSAVALHLSTRLQPDLPIILVDTGYLFPETYRFADELAARLHLNLKVVQPELSPARMEARHGRLWEQGVEGLNLYNRMRKVQPMQRAFDALGVHTWIAGIRRSQSTTRTNIDFLELRDGRWKLHPLADWNDHDIGRYLADHRLPYHPLWDQGYVSIGDTHTTVRWHEGMREEDTRFHGLKRECGLHDHD